MDMPASYLIGIGVVIGAVLNTALQLMFSDWRKRRRKKEPTDSKPSFDSLSYDEQGALLAVASSHYTNDMLLVRTGYGRSPNTACNVFEYQTISALHQRGLVRFELVRPERAGNDGTVLVALSAAGLQMMAQVAGPCPPPTDEPLMLKKTTDLSQEEKK